MSATINTALDDLDATVVSKVRKIIEEQWGKRMTDIQSLYVGRFYERITQEDGNVSYRPTERYVLRVQFRYAREPRRTLFDLM